MQVVEKTIRQRKIVPITIALAVVIAALIYYILENVDSAFAGAGLVLIYGFSRNAYFAIEQDRAEGVRFPLSQCFEYFLAVALVVWGFPIIESFRSLGEQYPNLIVFLIFYVLKLLLTFYFIAGQGEHREDRNFLVFLAYSFLVFASLLALLALEKYNFQSTSPGFSLLYWLTGWFPIPTVTLFIDMRRENRPSVRYAVWRSAIEILFVCPIFYFLANCLLTVLAIIAQEFGRMDFRLPRQATPPPLPIPN